MWFKREQKNRRLHRNHVLDVKLRSDQVRANRLRMSLIIFMLVAGPFFGFYLLWKAGEVGLDRFVYDNPDFAIQQVDVQTDGVIAPEQLRRWAGVKPGANLFKLDLAEVKRNLEMQSLISSVSVERVLPHVLKIRVAEREPIAQVNVVGKDATGAITVTVLQLDTQGMVMPLLDPRFSTMPVGQTNAPLPIIAGVNAFQLQLNHRVEMTQVQAALRLLSSFEHSPMAGLVDLRRVDVSVTGVLVATTGQGSEITFSLDNLDQQLARWRLIHDLGVRQQKTIATVDLAVANNVPVRWILASGAPEPQPRPTTPARNRRRHV
jgi:cell division septal protein FtsQ